MSEPQTRTKYYYDAEHHLVQVDGSEGWCQSNTGTAATACYTYDAEGRRVRRSVPGDGITDDFLYDLNGHFVTQVSGSGTWVRGEIYANGEHIATYENDLTTPTTFFTHGDHLGTERVETAVNGSSCETITNVAFGDGLNTSGSCDPTSLRFTGQQRDFETNLDNFGARFYSNQLGRFMSADPDNDGEADGDPQSWNGYSYVRNSALSAVDPTGLECVWDNGSFDAEDDPETGSVRSCQNKGGTWVELGQNGNWSGQGNSFLQSLVRDIQNGNVGSESVTTANGSHFTTDYNGSGQVTATITPNGVTAYAYSNSLPTSGAPPSSAGLALVGVGEVGCVIAEPCGAGEVTGAAIVGGFVLASAAALELSRDLSRHFAQHGRRNVLPTWAEGQRPQPGESARDFAKRLCDARYGAGNYNTGPGSEFSQIQKWARDKFGI